MVQRNSGKLADTVQKVENIVENKNNTRDQVSTLGSQNSELTDAIRLVSENLAASFAMQGRREQ